MNPIRVLIVDDHPMMREALRSAVETEPNLEVIGEAVNGQQAIQRTLALQPDVIVMDLYLPIMDGLEASSHILAANPSARIVMITSSPEEKKVVAAIQAGILGYMLKDGSRNQLIEAIKTVFSGKLFLPPEVSEKLAIGIRNGPSTIENSTPTSPLTQREQEILSLLGDCLSNQEISSKLNLSESTVRVHIFNLLNKLGLEHRNQAIAYAIQQGHPSHK